MKTRILTLLVCYLVCNVAQTAKNNQLLSCQTEKEYKNLIKTNPNLLIIYGKSAAAAKHDIKILKEVNSKVVGTASIAFINCE